MILLKLKCNILHKSDIFESGLQIQEREMRKLLYFFPSANKVTDFWKEGMEI